jgi:hypothetical protein
LQTAGGKLTPKQELGIVALLATGETKAAAAEIGVNEVTLWRWLQLPEFQSRYRASRRQVVETAIAQLQKFATTSVRVLVQVAVDKDAPASARVAAARVILEQGIKAVEMIDLQERIERLEETISARGATK